MTEYAASTHPGLKRSHNEDCYLADPELGLYLVADGVGGHAHGEIASAIVRDTLSADLREGRSLLEAIRHSHRAILEEIDSTDNTPGMGSTVVALQLTGGNYEIGWVGDSRAYLFDGHLTQLSSDHSSVGELLQRGLISPEEAASHPQRNILSQSLGVSAGMELDPGHLHGTLAAGQQLLLCSDGLSDELSDAEITHIMAQQAAPREQVQSLLKAALAAGGGDNITVVIVGPY